MAYLFCKNCGHAKYQHQIMSCQEYEGNNLQECKCLYFELSTLRGGEDMNECGTLLDWTRENDISPFYGIVSYDDDLKRMVVNCTNGGFIYVDDPETKEAKIIPPNKVMEYLKNEKIKFPDEDFSYIKLLAQPSQEEG